MAEVEVWIMIRGAVQHKRAATALAHIAQHPARFGLVKVECLSSDGDSVVGRMFVQDGTSAEVPRTAVQRALDEVANQTYPIAEQQIICFPLH